MISMLLMLALGMSHAADRDPLPTQPGQVRQVEKCGAKPAEPDYSNEPINPNRPDVWVA